MTTPTERTVLEFRIRTAGDHRRPPFGPLQRWPELRADPGDWTEHPLLVGYGGPQ